VRKHKIDIRSTLPFIGRKLDIALLRRCIRAALDAEGVEIPCEISVLITNDADIRAINKDFRGKDTATDVLSFPLQELIPGAFRPDLSETNRDTGRLMLGDIVLSAERIAAQAAEYGQSADREMAYLAVHSVLHLLGYDHLDEGAEKRRMRQREEAIIKDCFPQPV
jgi:probable rRNA maturation factor